MREDILAVVVRYNTPIAESESVQGMVRAMTENPALMQRFRILICDNSPEPLTDAKLPVPFQYQHLPDNRGVAGAFNAATGIALAESYTWMLLLDQDTGVTPRFLEAMWRHSRALSDREDVAAIAPGVFVKGFQVSPREQLFNRHRAYRACEAGLATGEAFAINSGTIMRVSALERVGGFSYHFWLDYSDMYVFHQFYLHGYKLWLAADTSLEHDMSIMDYERLMTHGRYRNFSHAESAFNDLYKGRIENTVQNLRLLVRAVRQRFKYSDPEFSRIALAQLMYRLTTLRRNRIAAWEKSNGRSV